MEHAGSIFEDYFVNHGDVLHDCEFRFSLVPKEDQSENLMNINQITGNLGLAGSGVVLKNAHDCFVFFLMQLKKIVTELRLLVEMRDNNEHRMVDIMYSRRLNIVRLNELKTYSDLYSHLPMPLSFTHVFM
ncbi:hypothetical protein C5167_022935 [Papaver somniferum]|uniref:Uncharacterized protein n=1 Tax=Papaver somniferum TaxID=3469 RepID=A0A4Y7JMH2_PAPSO|nr:hypothetical protein C5167_022935 [Papaver somniferum]